MGPLMPYQKRMLAASLMLMAAGSLVYWDADITAAQKTATLPQVLDDVPGWRRVHTDPLTDAIVEDLRLDDYVNSHYSDGRQTVALYVGYYLSSQKVGAAHSPLVCFPGQGWTLSDFQKKTVAVNSDEIDLMRLRVSASGKNQLLLYWFQAYDRTTSDTFLQKLYTLLAKITHRRQDNAFVRVTVPIEADRVDEAYAAGLSFIQAFFPQLLNHVREDA
jgi:EpsI family protein